MRSLRRRLALAAAACLASSLMDTALFGVNAQNLTDFSDPGPCSVQSWKTNFAVPTDVKGLGKTLPLTITVPACPAADPSRIAPPFPVLFFWSGFQAMASWYKHLVTQIASWGYVVVQYDTSMLSLPSVASEVAVFPSLLAWVRKETGRKGSKLNGVVDPAAVVVAGHSRGGKIAGVVFGRNPTTVKAAWLIDPIDASQWAPESPDNPSAAKALAEAGRPVGITGAGVLSQCNPTEGNYEVLFSKAAPGSWQVLIPGASHSLFSDAGTVLNAVQDTLCGKGTVPRAEVKTLTATPMLAWYWEQLRDAGVKVGPQANPMPAFYAWVEEEEAAGVLEFTVKGGAENIPPLAVLKAPEQQKVVFAMMG